MKKHKDQALATLGQIDYRHLFADIPHAFIIVRADDPEFTLVDENAAHARIVQLKPSHNIGKPILEAFPDNSEKYKQTGVSDLIESFRKVMRTGKADSMPLLQFDLKDKNGKFIEKWWRLTHHPLRDETGKVAFIYQATEDITAEIDAKNKLAVTQSQLNSALEIGLVSTWYWDITRNVVIGDSNLAKSFGLKPEKAAAGLPLDIFVGAIHPDDRDRVASAIQHSVAEHVEFEQEYRTIQKKAGVRWFIARGRVQCDAQDKPVYFLGVLVDITERKEAEQKLEHIRNMFNALFESSILCIAMADVDGNILEANTKFLKTLGYTHQDLKRGLKSDQLTPVYAKSKTNEIYDQLRTKGTLAPTEKDYIRRDGKVVPMLIGAAKLPNSENLFMAFMLDISENKELKALNVAKDEFVALASHQLRTPATAVKQYLGILIDEFAGPVTPDQLQYLNIAYNSNERQLNIINDLLKTAQLDTKGYRLTVDKVNVNQLIQEIITEFKAVTDAKKQIVSFKPTTPVIEALLDRDEMKLALTNLIENASKYTPSGKSIAIRTLRTTRYVTVTITDEGVGIAKHDHKIIFEKFTRINNALSDTVSGTGLGLYWVKRIIDLHGGLLLVDSELGKGTTFTIRLQA